MTDIAARLQPALAAYQQGELAEAERLCDEFLAADPRSFEAHHLLAVIHARGGRPAVALACYDGALALRPDEPQALSNRAVALDQLGRYGEAVASCDRALAQQPRSAPTWSNRGNSLRALGRFDEALASYDKALALQPDFADCRFNRALLLLLHGLFAEGWKDYEWRRRLAAWGGRRCDAAEWRGADLRGKRLLLHAEQGLGDTIQFARFVPLLAERGGDIVFEVQPTLGGLMQSLVGAARVVRQGEKLPPADFQLPLLSVPFVLGLGMAQIPAAVPYLQADPPRVAAWARRLPDDEFRVGIAWQGDPRRFVDRGRSIPLAAFAPLGEIPGVRLISLQKYHGVEPPAGMNLADLGPDFAAGADGFVDAAAVIAQLDLVVTSDNTIAHLAGALGRPVWLVLTDVPDWRWMLGRSDSPWYPTARLFRQRRRGDWGEVMPRVAEALAALAAARTHPAAARPAAREGLPAFVISLARRPERRARFLRWNAAKGIEFTIVDAVDGHSLRREDLLSRNIIADTKIGFSAGALGNALSHRSLWETCLARERPILVLEDDAILPDAPGDWLDAIRAELQDRCELLYVGYNRDAILSIGYGGQWCNLAFEQPPPLAVETLAGQQTHGAAPHSHAFFDVRLAWGTLGYAISPRGAQQLLRCCFPMSDKIPVRMYGSGRMFTPEALDGIINVVVQRQLVRARAVFPPLIVGPNDKSDSDVVPSPAGPPPR